MKIDEPESVPAVVAVELLRNAKDIEKVAEQLHELKATVDEHQVENTRRQIDAQEEARRAHELIHSRVSSVREDGQDGFKELRKHIADSTASGRYAILGAAVPICLLLVGILLKGGG